MDGVPAAARKNSIARPPATLEPVPVAAASKPVFTVSIRDLVEFVHRTGDLGGDGGFTGPNRALAGTLAHQRLQKSRPAGYQKEVRLGCDLEADEFVLRVQGRLDGIFMEKDSVRLEEIKTVGHGWDGQPDPLHWAQAKCYAHLYARDHQLAVISVQLTYLHLESRKVTEFCEAHDVAGLAASFAETVAIYQAWIAAQKDWRAVRDHSIRQVKFPFARYRPGQRELAVAAYRALAAGKNLFLEAPTGIGKTISVLFPAVKALGEGKLDRIFYLTATTTGRAVAEKAAKDLRRGGLRLRTLTLTAKAKLCLQNGRPCDPQTCPLALGYYDRRKPALQAALAAEEITRRVIESVGQKFQVCPFALSLNVSEWSDVVICDYNHVFDPKVYLRRHFGEDGGSAGFLVDEAHNLVDRAREMFSAELDSGGVRAVAGMIRRALPRCARTLNRLGNALRKLAESEAPAGGTVTDAAGELFASEPNPSPPPGRPMPHRDDVRVSQAFPETLPPLLEGALEATADWLAKNEPAEFREPLLDLYFQLHSFARTAELYDERYVTLARPGESARIKLFCLDPSFLLSQAMARGRATILFSATLAPVGYYRRLLGGEPHDGVLQLPSPFPPENLAVLVQPGIRTHFKERANTLAQVVRAIGDFVAARAGNYLVFLPAYQYLAEVLAAFQAAYPAITVLAQRPGLNETERDAFLDSFGVADGHTRVGFAVMGGIFGEGIDLAGDRLIGAVIVGVGLPQLDVERDLIADYFQEHHGSGFDYAYAFPGMNRVLQAAGRVIRSEADRGAVLLIDARFRESRYRRLFPAWWRPVNAGKPGEISAILRRFWTPPAPETSNSKPSAPN